MGLVVLYQGWCRRKLRDSAGGTENMGADGVTSVVEVVAVAIAVGVHRHCCVSCCMRRVSAESVLVGCSGQQLGGRGRQHSDDGPAPASAWERVKYSYSTVLVRNAVCGYAGMKLD